MKISKMYIFEEKAQAEIFIKFLNEIKIPYRQIWQSKYNRDISYDYEPFCNDGFNINIEIKQIKENKNKILFSRYLYEKTSKMLNHLELCYNKELI